jgi:dTDP-4-dehydrorhamnose reductase
LVATVRAVQPDVIVNAAAYTAVDRAESEQGLVFAVNAEAPAVLAREAASLGACLLHYSTDYVFDGSGSSPRDESASTGPLSVYGHSKLAGEESIRTSGCQYVILRTGWVYGTRGGNFVRTMLRLARERDSLTVVDDQVGAPTGADLLADVSAHVLRQVLERSSLAGTYHVVAAGETSWHGYAKLVIAWAHAHGVPLRLRPDAIEAVASGDYPTPARRPLNSRLATGKLETAFDLVLPPWQSGVVRTLDEIHDGLRSPI